MCPITASPETTKSEVDMPLSNFGTVNFTNATADNQPIGNENAAALTLQSAAGRWACRYPRGRGNAHVQQDRRGCALEGG
jgi:hypothetical protein